MLTTMNTTKAAGLVYKLQKGKYSHLPKVKGKQSESDRLWWDQLKKDINAIWHEMRFILSEAFTDSIVVYAEILSNGLESCL